MDADFAVSRARYRSFDPAQVSGPFIPGSIEKTHSVGIAADDGGPWSGGLRLRYFGPRALTEDNSVRSPASSLVNARLAYRWSPHTRFTLDLLNLFNNQVSDIDYYYASQLRTEAAPVAGILTHPAEPRSLRLTVRQTF